MGELKKFELRRLANNSDPEPWNNTIIGSYIMYCKVEIEAGHLDLQGKELVWDLEARK